MDGGLTALGGFLYQTVVALSLKAETFQEYQDAPPGKEDLETVLGFAKEGEVRYEDEDQDVSIRTMLHDQQPGYILVQIKYSRLFPRPPITKNGLKKIIERLQASEAKAHQRGHQVTGYSLLTNRPVNDDAQRTAQACPLPFHIVSSIPEHFWESRLRQFAQRFSCTDYEIESGIRQGIGAALQKVTNPHSYGEPVITKEQLIELFTGEQQAHAVTPEIVAEKSQQCLKELFTNPFHLDLQPLVVRQNIQQHLSELVEQHAFVVLSGFGGNGKTALLWQWMDDSLRFELPQQGRVYYHLSPSQRVQENFLAQLFCTWAHVPSLHRWHQQEPEQILDRLETARTANMKDTPINHSIFVLGLDAVDERFREGDRNALSDLLLWFWNQEKQLRQRPRATLIITCRDSKELADRWLHLSSPYEEESKPFHNVELEIDVFSVRELISSAHLHLPDLAERFEKTYRALEAPSAAPLVSGQAIHPFFLDEEMPTFSASDSGEMEGVGLLMSESPFRQAVDTEVFEALRHPTLWHCLLRVDGVLQSRVLDGEPEALAHLARQFLTWFCHKARARGKLTRNEEMIEVLKVIAYHCDPRHSLRQRKKDWLTHANQTSYMNNYQAMHFFEEALSAGLIEDDTGGWWRWRHPFIGKYLASQASNEEDE